MGEPVDLEFFLSFLLPASLGLFAFLIRFSVKREKVAVISFILDAISAIFVGILVAMAVEDYDFPDRLKWAIVTVGALLGPELLSGVLQISTMFSRSPVTLTLRVLRVVKGKPMTADELKEMATWEKDFQREIRNEKLGGTVDRKRGGGK
tara:strand:+ start:5719 stop:6168 length:450 start_codon:yes stop_codon:yes gene_type:complete